MPETPDKQQTNSYQLVVKWLEHSISHRSKGPGWVPPVPFIISLLERLALGSSLGNIIKDTSL